MERPNCSSISQGFGVTTEPQWENSSGSCGVSETASRPGLYANYEAKDEVLVGPVCFQLPVAAFVAFVPVQKETEAVTEAGLRDNAGPGRTDTLQELQVELGPHPEPQHPEWAALPHFTIDNCGQLVSPSTENEHIWAPMPDAQIKNKLHNKDTIFSCKTCHKEFKQLCDYKTHKLSHSEKPYQCKRCYKTFSLADNLKKHKLVHSKTKFTCDECQKKFTRFSNLKFHKMIHEGVKPFSCELCKMKFKRSGHLRAHLKSHTGEKPFVCDLCEKRFSRLNHLREHKLLHEGHKPFQCDVCEKQFARAGTLNVHKRIHSENKPFSCDVCLKQFTQRVLRDRHKESHAKR